MGENAHFALMADDEVVAEFEVPDVPIAYPKEKHSMAQFEGLGLKLDKESWDWLDTYHPTIADELMAEVGRGSTAESLRNFVRKRVGVHRDEFAIRCEADARYLESQVKK